MAYEIVISDWSADVGSSDLATNLWVGSSNLSGRAIDNTKAGEAIRRLFCVAIPPLHAVLSGGELEMEAVIAVDGAARFERHAQVRSEEHTSELQSLMRISYAVFCLKKKTTKYIYT